MTKDYDDLMEYRDNRATTNPTGFFEPWAIYYYFLYGLDYTTNMCVM